ncbi:MAG: hypothetical protein AUK28_07240 [Desulfobacterales bacterium CG2_30_60_27]|nr:MAG: hypothetical protein AUK28_07240 [Desulfobacterales bacterium CG2_30_60_27]
MTTKPPSTTRSVRTLFLLAMTVLILVLSVPLLFSGGHLLDNIIQQLGSQILQEKLAALVSPVTLRYETLRRIGLEDSLVHREEIKDQAMASFAKFHYMKTGEVFVIRRDGTILRSHDFKYNKGMNFENFLARLAAVDQGMLDYTAAQGRQLAACQYFPPWDSYVGLTISRAELFAPSRLFFEINCLVLAVVVGIALLFTLGLQWLIIAPLIRLTDFATRVSRGDFNAEVQGAFILELAVLKEDIIAMVASLRQKVEESTRQLTVIRQREAELDKAFGELRESEERYREIFNAPSDAIFIHDAETGAIVDVNQAMLDMYGYSRAEALRLRAEEASANIPPYSAAEASQKIAAAVAAGPQLFVWRARKKDGTLFWVEVALRCKAFNNRQYIIAVVRDISARKEAEEALAAEKERLAVTLRSIGDGVITTDTAGRITLLNAVAETLTGWRQDEAVGRPLPEIFHIINEKTGEPGANPVDKVIATGANVELANHTVLIARDGARRSIADSGAPIRDKAGGSIGVVLVFRDVTEKLRTDQELLKIKKLESVGVLAAGIAHDFNNILAAILGNLDLARTLLAPGQEAAVLIEEAAAASLRARDLTQQLLTFARGGAPVRQAASIAAVIKDSTAFVLRGSEVDATFDIPDDLWLVDIDTGQMSQVIQNIIINARQAMPESGKVSITCRNLQEYANNHAGEPARFVSIAISNPGDPIPEHLLDTIFDPYFTTKKDGSGLGLAVCHSIIAKHDGRIEVSSVPGRDTTFTIVLPASQKTSVAARQVERAAGLPTQGRILVMDDEETIRQIAQKMLRRMGHEVDTVEGGRQAIKDYQQAMTTGRRYDLVIMDLTIPGGMGGKEASREILALDPAAVLIVSSGYSNDPVMADFAAYGFAGVIAKPFLLADLTGAVDRQLAKKLAPS